jgi:hypothetical protein
MWSLVQEFIFYYLFGYIRLIVIGYSKIIVGFSTFYLSGFFFLRGEACES